MGGSVLTGTVKTFMDELNSARGQGQSYGQALKSAASAVPEGAFTAIGAWADQRASETGTRLTPAQRAFYRSSLFESVAGLSIPGDYNGQSGVFRDQLIREHGAEVGIDIADLLRRAATQNRPDLVGLVGQYNHAMGGTQGVSAHASESVKKNFPTTPDALKPVFHDVESRYHLPSGLLERMASVESNWHNHAISPKGALGLMQLMPDTARRFSVTDPTDPKQAIEGAGKYMRWLLDRYDGNLEKAVAAYNAGEGNVDKHNGVPPFAETREYIKRVLG
jgi:conjugal transfer mating pair stabilization protein TraG